MGRGGITHLDLYHHRHLVTAGNGVMILLSCVLSIAEPQLYVRWTTGVVVRTDRVRLLEPMNCSEFKVNSRDERVQDLAGRSSVPACGALDAGVSTEVTSAFVCSCIAVALACISFVVTTAPVLHKRFKWKSTAIASLYFGCWVFQMASVFQMSQVKSSHHEHFRPYVRGVAPESISSNYDKGFGFGCFAIAVLCVNFVFAMSTRGGIYDDDSEDDVTDKDE